MGQEREYVIAREAMESFYDEPGERGWILEGHKHGLTATSLILTETAPGGGPPLHHHRTEEVHVLQEGRLDYLIGEQRFTAEGPYVVRLPAGVPHTFVNAGDAVARLVCFFPDPEFWAAYRETGPNPLVSTA